jgi:alanine-glyoxylate transaminase/serine-glyoxylate transaminase/serine-pyruvate transaminase
MLGHLHGEFLKIMDDVREGCKYVFQTRNKLTFVVSGTGKYNLFYFKILIFLGHAGMEAALLNVLEPGERILVVQNGLWGQRAAILAKRLKLEVNVLSVPDGKAVELADLKDVSCFICFIYSNVIYSLFINTNLMPFLFVKESRQLVFYIL